MRFSVSGPSPALHRSSRTSAIRGKSTSDSRARLGDAEQDVFFLLREALHRIDEVRNQIGTALVLVVHFRPARLHLLVVLLDGVVTAIRQAERRQRGEYREDFSHNAAPKLIAVCDPYNHRYGSCRGLTRGKRI